MTECARCGDCCRRIPLASVHERADVLGKALLADPRRSHLSLGPFEPRAGAWMRQAAWMAQLEPISGPHYTKDGKPFWYYRCPRFDEQTNLCTDHGGRPGTCKNFPWYGKDPSVDHGADLSPRCSFNADVRKMLPIVEVT